MTRNILSTIISVALLTACNDSNLSSTPITTIAPSDRAEHNIFVSHASTYPRSVITGLIAAKSSDRNDIFDLYYWNGTEKQIADNVFVRGSVPMVNESLSSATSGCNEGCGNETPKKLQELEEISKIVMAAPEGIPVNLVIEETFIRHSTELMTSEALARINSITVVLEGSGSIVPNNRLDRVIDLADQAQAHGVKTFKVQIFDSMNLDVLAQDHDQWNKIIHNQYITIFPVSFSKLGNQISDGYETNVLANLIETFGYDLKTAFTKSPQYDENKKLLVFFGSSRNSTANTPEGRKGGNYNNMMLIESYLQKPEITEKYNIAIKPHPKLNWINTYISESGVDVSYFSSMPYELLAIAGGKNINGFSVPMIDRVDSTYSTILFSVDADKINSIIDYSPYYGFSSENDSVEFMKENYSLDYGWGIPSYEDYASALKYQIGAPHIEVTNVEAFVNN